MQHPQDHSQLEISDDKGRLDVPLIHHFLSEEAYWCLGIPQATVQRAINHSLCFGGYVAGQQVAFARVITDRATFGYLADVFVLPAPAIAGTAAPQSGDLGCPRPLCRFWLRAAAQTGQPDGKVRSRDLSAPLSSVTQAARGARRFMQHAPALWRRGVTVPDEGVRDLIVLGPGH